MEGTERIEPNGSSGAYNEAVAADGTVREPYGPLVAALGALGGRKRRAESRLKDLGATFPLPNGGDREKILPADWTPRLVCAADWERLSEGLLQRGRAINAWLSDLYEGGEQTVVPEAVVRSSALYNPSAFPGAETTPPVHVYGPDVVHLGDGDYIVLEDNVRVPSGVAYADCVRQVGREVYAELFELCPGELGDPTEYYAKLRETLLAAAPPRVRESETEPAIVLLTSGKNDSAYFEHARLATRCGFELLTADGLEVGRKEVRTRRTGRRVDVIYRRVDDGGIVREIEGLGRVCRENNVAIVNAPGVGVADDKGVFPYVPEMIRTYLGEEPHLNSARTIALADPEGREEALERLPELVLKPREGYGGLGVLIGPEADREEIEEARRKVRKEPGAFVAQECLDFSTHLTDPPEGRPGAPFGRSYIDLRAFVLPVVGYVMPGGLTRVAKAGTRVVNSSSGGGLKDTWVLKS
ncbi:hypothetical protein RradSPS_0773 [Rubrobacter radiotolerans]|uniref:Circularly permuted type 2 ATP-grasp protein n=1 Tax=Rubrobacter radiotolerans TaxID=42256 RepID=A0A023X1L6_RUBRA|nr:circularly permuted type 2 ATP-grasp protein [Rubrobacter radiotolerans]AHY46056.1 hypothetical protein RradSPS_0773 [Rubrobacter radiotolerans]MDX5893466.1 circularly permuted type 2 ATP-grasp protein [Rubrobacter radiotolerans]SMC03784.1 Uncharacterized conserved protein, circularly permuted ATPgrasp superfamily [Rubrobacter radiotolerans DSM 5868]